MDLTTIRGIAKARWWVLVIAVLIAVNVAGRLTEYRNDHLPEYEAMTSVTFIEDPQALERDDFEAFLETQFALAMDINSDVLDETPGPFIPWLLAELDLETDQNQIQFIGRGFTQEEADLVALAMRERFLAASPIGAGQERITAELEELTSQIAQLRADIARAQEREPLTSEELTLQAQRAALESRIAALRSRYGQLGVELVNPVLRSEAAIRAEMERVLTQLVDFEQELASIPQPRTPEEAQAANEGLLLDELRLEQLEARWKQIYLGQRELRALATVSDLVSQPVDLDAASPVGNQLLALIGALAVALAGLVALDRARGVVWSPAGIDEDGPPIVSDLPPRGLRAPADQPWYVAIYRGRRKAAIQMLRSQVDHLEHAVLALQGSGVFPTDIRELGADLATSLAVSGKTALLIDSAFGTSNELMEFPPEGTASLSKLLRIGSEDPEEVIAEYKEALLGRPQVIRGLRTLRAGNGDLDPADALAGYRFELLLQVARELFDVVVLCGGDADEPASHVLAQRVDAALLVGSAGHTVGRAAEAAAWEFSHRRADLLGLILLRRRPSRIRRWFASRFQTRLWELTARLLRREDGIGRLWKRGS